MGIRCLQNKEKWQTTLCLGLCSALLFSLLSVAKDPPQPSSREIWSRLFQLQRLGDSVQLEAEIRRLLSDHAGDAQVEILVRQFVQMIQARHPGSLPRQIGGTNIQLAGQNEKHSATLHFSVEEIASISLATEDPTQASEKLNQLQDPLRDKLILLGQQGLRPMPRAKPPPIRILLDADSAFLIQSSFDILNGNWVTSNYTVRPEVGLLLDRLLPEIAAGKVQLLFTSTKPNSISKTAFPEIDFKGKTLPQWGITFVPPGELSFPIFDLVPSIEDVETLQHETPYELSLENSLLLRRRNQIHSAATELATQYPEQLTATRRADLLEQSRKARLPTILSLRQIGLRPSAPPSATILLERKRVLAQHPTWGPLIENPKLGIMKLLQRDDLETLGKIVEQYPDPQLLSELAKALGNYPLTTKSRAFLSELIAKRDPAMFGYIVVNTFTGTQASQLSDLLPLLLDAENHLLALTFARWYSNNYQHDPTPKAKQALEARISELLQIEKSIETRLELATSLYRLRRDEKSYHDVIDRLNDALGTGKVAASQNAVRDLLEHFSQHNVRDGATVNQFTFLLNRPEVSNLLGPFSKYLRESHFRSPRLISEVETKLRQMSLRGASSVWLGEGGAKEFFALIGDRLLSSPKIVSYLEDLPHWRRGDPEAIAYALRALKAIAPERFKNIFKTALESAGGLTGRRLEATLTPSAESNTGRQTPKGKNPGICRRGFSALSGLPSQYLVGATAVMGFVGEAALEFEHVRLIYDIIGREE